MVSNYVLDKLLLIKDIKAIKEVLMNIRGDFEKQAKKQRDNWHVMVAMYYILMFQMHWKEQFKL